jgi:uncharacterized protein (TIGR02600 family)
MKANTSTIRHRSRASRGFVLILVLAFLALITVLVLSFFLSVSTQLSASKGYANGSNAKELADSAVQAVIGQLRLATASTDSSGQPVAWASQPGMIRSFTSAGAASTSYKLYSSNNMIVSGAPTLDFTDDFDSTWSATSTPNPALYTDLNSPITSNGNLLFPIIDPRAAGVVSGSYPLVDGFSYTSTAGVGATTVTIPGLATPASSSDTSARLPMPVKWIYLLKDGTMTAPTSGSGSTATWTGTGATVPTSANPIVGRIAFWTDDETCKLNVNTACGGTYWDTPRLTAGLEMAYSRYKPVANEFNRFPGHPATTSLLPVFWSYAGLTSPNTNLVPTVYASGNPAGTFMSTTTDVVPALTTLASNTFAGLLNFSPRNAPGGSQFGTIATTGFGATPPSILQLDADRLFATVDEALYAPPTSASAANSNRVANAFTTASGSTNSLAPGDVEKLRFFLTANSRAPELNPFNLPKISMWPVPTGVKQTLTSMDSLLAFCSTLNGKGYYFTRNDSISATSDWTTRNDNIFDYLINQWGQPVPGFGGTLKTRFTQDGENRLLTLMYDYIRSTVNIFDTNGASGATYNTASYPSAFIAETNFANLGFGQVTPIQITKGGVTYKGLGRFPGIKQIAIMFIATAANQPPAIIGTNGVPSTTPNPMHPWVNTLPTSITVVSNANHTYDLTASNAYPTISGQTHAGLPYLSTKWADTSATAAVLATIINPRYQGPIALYGAGSGTGAVNSASLPSPSIDPATGTLKPHLTQVQAIILVDPVDPAAGQVAIAPAFMVEITGLDSFKADGQSLGFGPDLIQSSIYKTGSNITGSYNLGMQTISTEKRTTTGPYGSSANFLAFVSQPVIVGNQSTNFPTDGGSTFNFTGNTSGIVVKIYAPGSKVGSAYLSNSTSGATLVQTLTVKFPDARFPTPLLPAMPAGIAGMTSNNSLLSSSNTQYTTGITQNAPTTVTDLCPSSLLTFDFKSGLGSNPNFGVGSALYAQQCAHTYFSGANDQGSVNYLMPERSTLPSTDYHAKLSSDTVRSMEVLYGDTRLASAFSTVPASFFAPHKFYSDTTMRAAHTLRGGSAGDAGNYRGATAQYLTAAYKGVAAASLSATSNLINYDFYLHNTDGRGVSVASPTNDILNLAALNTIAAGNSSSSIIYSSFPYVTSSTEFDDTVFAGVTLWTGLTSFSTVWANGGDFETGVGSEPDGPTINKINEADASTYGNVNYTNPDFNVISGNAVGYRVPESFSPNRLMPSPVVFGSLPVPVDSANSGTPDITHSWRTLLFSPNPASYDITKTTNATQTRSAIQQVTDAGSVPGGTTAPDHLLLDFFNMPVVAPYAISEPFSTAGKVNMNYQIAPFSYITRNTALRGVLRDSVVTAIDDKWIGNYKTIGNQYANSGTTSGDSQAYYNFLTGTGNWGFRYPVDAADTLKQFDQRFANNDVFRSPSEICSLWLYPATQPTAAAPENPNTPLVTWDANSTNIKNWWYSGTGTTAKSITGDNVRERPYATIYPRLTTKSNTYTVHFCVQVLQKVPTTGASQWVEGTDTVQSEYRGSSIIERYIDPGDTTIPDVATTTTSASVPSLDANYRYRIVSTQKFAP